MKGRRLAVPRRVGELGRYETSTGARCQHMAAGCVMRSLCLRDAMRSKAISTWSSRATPTWSRGLAAAQCRVGGSTISRWTPWQAVHCSAQYSAPARPAITRRMVSRASHSGHRERTEEVICQVTGLAMETVRIQQTTSHLSVCSRRGQPQRLRKRSI